jgi:hypothetical protein
MLDENEVGDKLRDLNLEGRIGVDLREIPNEFMDWFWFLRAGTVCLIL